MEREVCGETKGEDSGERSFRCSGRERLEDESIREDSCRPSNTSCNCEWIEEIAIFQSTNALTA